jgi:hypothetical protein
VARGPAALAWHFSCPDVPSHPLRLPATASMRLNQRFPNRIAWLFGHDSDDELG